MEDLPKLNNLLVRNGAYYFRVRVPQDLLVVLGKKEIKKSLGTKNLSEVKTKLAIETLRAEELFTATRRKLASESRLPILGREQDAQLHLPSDSATPPLSISKADIERMVQLWHIDQEAIAFKEDDLLRTSRDDLEGVKENLIDDYAHFSSNSYENNAASVQSETNQIFKHNGISHRDMSADLYNYANLIVKQSLIERTSSSLLRFGYKLDRVPFQLFSQALRLPSTTHLPIEKFPSKISHPLGRTIESFYSAKRSEEVTEKSLASYKLTFDLMRELFGISKAVEDITPTDCRTFKENLIQLPSNSKKKYPNLTLLESIEKRAKDQTGALSTTSVNNYLKCLSAFFNFAVRERLISHNPAEHIGRVKIKWSENSKKRFPFKDREIRDLFSSPVYKNSGNMAHSVDPSKFWIPIIGLYQGMRLNEICQLFVSDICFADGVPFIHVRPDYEGKKTVKTEASIRKIPIHKRLIAMGFLDYVREVERSSSEVLFPDLTISARGSPSDNFSKWFHRYLIKLGIKRPGLCFHSFRHRFYDQCRAQRIPSDISSRLGGWTVDEKERGRASRQDAKEGYGDGYELHLLQEDLDKTNNIELQVPTQNHM